MRKKRKKKTERVTRRIKESSESRGRRPFQEDDDAFLSGNMVGSLGKRKSKSHPCVVRLPMEPDRRSLGTSLATFMPAFRGTKAI